MKVVRRPEFLVLFRNHSLILVLVKVRVHVSGQTLRSAIRLSSSFCVSFTMSKASSSSSSSSVTEPFYTVDSVMTVLRVPPDLSAVQCNVGACVCLFRPPKANATTNHVRPFCIHDASCTNFLEAAVDEVYFRYNCDCFVVVVAAVCRCGGGDDTMMLVTRVGVVCFFT